MSDVHDERLKDTLRALATGLGIPYEDLIREPLTEDVLARIAQDLAGELEPLDSELAADALRLVAEVRRLRAALQRIAADDTLLYDQDAGEPAGRTSLRRIARNCLDPTIPLSVNPE